MKKKFKNYAEELYRAGFVISTNRENHESFNLTKGQTAYLLSILGKRYCGFGLFLAFDSMYKNHQELKQLRDSKKKFKVE